MFYVSSTLWLRLSHQTLTLKEETKILHRKVTPSRWFWFFWFWRSLLFLLVNVTDFSFISLTQIGIFSFNSYVYYLSRGFIASTCAFNLLTCEFELATRGFELVTRNSKLMFYFSTLWFSLPVLEFKDTLYLNTFKNVNIFMNVIFFLRCRTVKDINLLQNVQISKKREYMVPVAIFFYFLNTRVIFEFFNDSIYIIIRGNS